MSGPQEYRLRRAREVDREKESDLVIPASRKDVFAAAASLSSATFALPALQEGATMTPTEAKESGWAAERNECLARIEDLSRENAFYREQMRRLNIELSRYQSKYPTVPREQTLDENSLAEHDPLPPWLVSSHYLTPLLTAYDDRLHELHLQCDDYRNQLQLLKKRADDLVTENERMNIEVRSYLETLVRKGEEEEQRASIPGQLARVAVEDWDGLQAYCEQLSEENKTLNELKNLQKRQIEATLVDAKRIEMENQEFIKLVEEMKIEIDERDTIIQHMRNERGQSTGQLQTYLNEVEATRKERDRMQTELRKLRDDLMTSNTKLPPNYQAEIGQISRTLETILSRPPQSTGRDAREQEDWVRRQREVFLASEAVEAELHALREKYNRCAKELQQKTKDLDDMNQAAVVLQRRLSELQQQIVIVSKSEQSALDLVQEANLERDQSLKREEKAVRDCERLNAKISDLQAQLQDRVDSELSSANIKHTSQSNVLMEEIKALELATSTHKANAERAVRDKRAAESELEKLRKAIPENQHRSSQLLEEVSMQLRSAERDRDENAQKVESAQNALRVAQGQIQKMKAEKESALEECYQRISSLELALEAAKSERTKLSIQLEEAQKQLRMITRDRDEISKRATLEKNTLTSYYEEQVRNLDQRLSDTHTDRERLYRELERALNDRDRIAAKAREELRVVTHKQEGAISDLKSDLSRLTERAKEAQARNEDLRIDRMEKEQAIENLQKGLQQAHVANDALQRRVAELTNQIGQLNGHEVEFLKERKELLRRIDRLNLEKDRQSREYDRVLKRNAELEREITSFQDLQIARTGEELEDEALEFLTKAAKSPRPTTRRTDHPKAPREESSISSKVASRSPSEASEKTN